MTDQNQTVHGINAETAQTILNDILQEKTPDSPLRKQYRTAMAQRNEAQQRLELANQTLKATEAQLQQQIGGVNALANAVLAEMAPMAEEIKAAATANGDTEALLKDKEPNGATGPQTSSGDLQPEVTA